MEKRNLAVIVTFVEGEVELYEVRNLGFIKNLRKTKILHPFKLTPEVKDAIISQLKAFGILPKFPTGA